MTTDDVIKPKSQKELDLDIDEYEIYLKGFLDCQQQIKKKVLDRINKALLSNTNL